MAGPLTPRNVFRYFETDGVPDSGPHDPVKSEIIQLLEQLFGTSRGGWIVTGTLAELNGITPENETDGGVVLTGTGAGYYERDGGAWVFGRGFPDTFAKVSLSGTGSAQTGSVNAGVNPASIEVFFAFVQADNTGPLTLSIAGAPAKPVVNVAGNPLAAGEWTGTVLFVDRGDRHQLLFDAQSAIIATQQADRADTEADRSEAEANRSHDEADRAASYAAGVLTGNPRDFKTVAALLVDTSLTYSGSDALTVVPGDIVTAQGFRYEVVASDAASFDIETAGGVKLVLAQYDESLREQARSIIGANYGKLAKLMASNRRITFHDPERSKIGHAMGVLPNGRIVVCYRSATTHNIAASRMEAIYSDDGGLTWSAPVIVVETADHDYRNYAAGVTQNGVFVVATEDITVSTSAQSGNRVRFYKSTDGISFSAGAAMAGQVTRIVPYGALVHRDDGSSYFRSYHGHHLPEANADGDQSLFSSSDDFDTFSFSTIWDGPGASGPYPVEPYTVALDANNHVSFMRREKTDDDTPLLMKSTDGGITWSAPTEITTLAMGRNPSCLWYDDSKEVLYAIWPSRGTLQLTNGGDFTIFPWYYSSITKSQLISDGTKWRAQTPFALFCAPQEGSFALGYPVPGGNGDTGYPHVFEAHGMKFMLYYSGSFGGGQGSDIYIANLSTLIGI